MSIPKINCGFLRLFDINMRAKWHEEALHSLWYWIPNHQPTFDLSLRCFDFLDRNVAYRTKNDETKD